MINIVILAAGQGKRFTDFGYPIKPLIDINGKPMLEKAVQSFVEGIEDPYRLFIIFRSTNLQNDKNIIDICKRCNAIPIFLDQLTGGPAITALAAHNHINSNDSLIIANCDQIMNWNIQEFIDYANSLDKSYNGVVITFSGGEENKHSFIKYDENEKHYLTEKIKISDHALAGIHFWHKGKDFVKSCIDMIVNNHVAPNGEFYISLSYNYLPPKVKVYPINKTKFFPVGVPEELKSYLALKHEN
jgi:molybdopterin-guanine dinucleotide biosynthesis protein A